MHKLSKKELQELMDSPKKFLSKDKNLKKILGTDLMENKSLKDQIILKNVLDEQELHLKMAKGRPQEYYAVTSVCRFISRVQDIQEESLKKEE